MVGRLGLDFDFTAQLLGFIGGANVIILGAEEFRAQLDIIEKVVVLLTQKRQRIGAPQLCDI